MKRKLNKISILIINYNTDDLTIQAVNSVNNYVKDLQYEIIVVDNCSPNGSNLNKKLKSIPNTFFYQLNQNIGFGRANNFAYSKSKGDYVFLLNSDAYLISDIFPKLIKSIESNTDIGCLSPNILLENRELAISYGSFLTKKKILNDLGLKKQKNEELNEISTSKKFKGKTLKRVDYVTGAAMLLKRDTIEEHGFFNSSYFMYFEDMDLCFRYKSNGLSSAIEPECEVVHIGGQSYLKTDFTQIKKVKIILRSKYIFSKNLFSERQAKTYYFLSILKAYKINILTQLKVKILKLIKVIIKS